MKQSCLLLTLLFLTSSCTDEGSRIPSVTACELYSNPEQFDGRLVEVTGSITVQFESSSLHCRDRDPSDAKLSLGISLELDQDSIRQRSPQFHEVIVEGVREAARFKGGLIGEMRFRGYFSVSQDWIDTAVAMGKQRVGFGHLGSYGAKIVVREILDYRSTAKMPNKAPEPTPTSVMPRATSRKSERSNWTEIQNPARVMPAVVVAHL